MGELIEQVAQQVEDFYTYKKGGDYSMFVFTMNNWPQNNAAKVYLSIAIANLWIFENLNNKKVINQENPLYLNWSKDKNVREVILYLWTALILLGQTPQIKFGSNAIEFTRFQEDAKKTFSKQLGYFTQFSGSSIYNTVFKPILEADDVKIEYDADEYFKEFGHQIPAKKVELRSEIQTFFSNTFISNYLEIKDKKCSIRWTGNDNKTKTLYHLGPTKIAQALSFLPPDVEEIQMQDFFKILKPGELSRVIASVPNNVTCLNFWNTDLTRLTQNALDDLLKAIPPHIKTLDLRKSKFECLNINNLINILTTVEFHIVNLYLGNNNLYTLGADNLARVIETAPQSLRYLDLGSNALYKLGGSGLAKVLGVMPKHIVSLNLYINNLSALLLGNQLAISFSAIPSTITWLNLDDNNLGTLEVSGKEQYEELSMAFAALHSGIKTLYLRKNNFVFPQDGKQNLDVFQPIKTWPSYPRIVKYTKLFSCLPKQITSLYLDENLSIYASKGKVLAEIFKYAPSGVTILEKKLQEWIENALENEINSRRLVFRQLAKKADVTIQELAVFLEDNVEIDCQDTESGYTALMYAIDANNERLAEYLLNNGANPLIKNKRNETAADLVSKNSFLFQILKEKERLFSGEIPLIENSNVLSQENRNNNNQDIQIKVEGNIIEASNLTSTPLLEQASALSVSESSIIIPQLVPVAVPIDAQLNHSPAFFNPSSQPSTKKESLPVEINLSIDPQLLSLREKIANGGYGEIYKGKWQGRTVAIKELRIKTLTSDACVEFQREAVLMVKVNSPLVVRVYGMTLGFPYRLVMELMKGGSLFEKLKSKEEFSWEKRVKTALNIAQGIKILHQNDIFHRDLKSMNILLDEKGNIKLADFGLAQIKNEIAFSGSKTRVGTVAWMAPELFGRKPKYTAACDIYSLGMVFWELVSAKLPFSDAADSSLIPIWVQQGEREDIPSTTPDWYQNLIKQCWHGDAIKRPSLAEIVNTLAVEYQKLKQLAITQQQVVLNSNSRISNDENGLLFQSANVLPSGEYLPSPSSMNI